jgi:hypothetical protein
MLDDPRPPAFSTVCPVSYATETSVITAKLIANVVCRGFEANLYCVQR